MPNRVIREGILTSTRVDQVATIPAREVFYRRLQSVVDDYGRFTGDARVIRAACYPLRLDSITERDIAEHLRECERAELLRLYSVDGKPYLELIDFNQQLRIKRSKYPEYTVGARNAPDEQVLGTSSSRVFVLLPESESESEIEVESDKTICAPKSGARVVANDLSYKKESLAIQQDAWFSEWWTLYWLHKSRKAARVAFGKHIKTEARFDEVMAATKSQSAEMLAREASRRPHGATWLNGERWLDEPAEAAPQARSEALSALYEELAQENNGIPESN
jgi:hypothetical protein